MQSRALRRKGKSIGEIANLLEVSKGTVSVWCREVQLTKAQQTQLTEKKIKAGHRGRSIGTERNRQKRLDSIRNYEQLGKREIGQLTKRDLTILAAALFWAEGSKTGSRFVFVNSDPDMVVCMCRFLTDVAYIEKEQLLLRVQINRIHEPRIKTVLKYWSMLLGIPKNQIGAPYFVNTVPRKKYQNHDTYYGIARLTVRRGSGLQYQLLGYISALKQAT